MIVSLATAIIATFIIRVDVIYAVIASVKAAKFLISLMTTTITAFIKTTMRLWVIVEARNIC
jgi:hypothetical protein